MNRFGESPGEGRYYRTERYIEINASWYLVLRGGEQHGPFDSRSGAQQALSELLSVPGNSEPRRRRDRNQFKAMRNSGQQLANARSASSNVVRLRPARKAKQTRIEFTPVAHDVDTVSQPNGACANEGHEDFSAE